MNKNLSELAKKHSDHSIIANEKKTKKTAFLDEATRIYEQLYDKIDFSDPFNSSSKELGGTEACLFGTLCKLLGMDDDAGKIYSGLKDYMEEDCGLYSPRGIGFPNTEENAAVGVFLKAMGKGKRAEKLYDNMKPYRESGLYNHNSVNKKKYVENNALMGILASSLGKTADAKRLFNKIGSKIGKTGDLYNFVSNDGDIDNDVSSYANAGMASYCLLIGMENEGDKIYESLLSKMPTDGTLISRFTDSAVFGMEENSLVGIYLCLKAGKCISPSKKDLRVK